MGFNYNKGTYGGRFVADPELRQTSSGKAFVSFTLAIDRPYRNGGNKVSDFLNFVAFDRNAEAIARYFRKGNTICVTGALQCRRWSDREGQTRYAYEIAVEDWTFVDNKQASDVESSEEDFRAEASSRVDTKNNAGGIGLGGDIVGSVIPDDIDGDLPF